MSSEPPSKPKGLFLYANLLDPSNDPAPGTITGAPVVYTQSSNGDASSPGEGNAPKQAINAGRY
jgi:hypothetical protein